MRKGWQESRVGDVCKVVAGQSPKGSAYNNHGDGLPFHQGKKYFRESLLGDSNTWTTQVTKEAFPGDILMSVRAPVGPINFTDQHMCIGRGLAAIRATDKVDRMFLFYWLSFIQSEIQGNEGAVFASINKQQIETIALPLPPLPEQKRIVAILDEAFAGIATAVANTEKNLANARELFESYLSLVLLDKHWQWRKLGDLCHGFEYGSSAKSKKLGMVPVVRMGNIQGGQISWQDLVYSDNQEEIQRYLLKPNDVLFNRTNSPELVGKTGVYKDQRPAIFAGYLIRINRIEDQLDADFLNYFLNSKIASDYGSTVVTSSVNQANINATKLSGYPIPAPPLTEQKRIVGRLNELQGEIHRIEQIYQHKLASFAELKQSLLQIAFSGELTTASRNEIETAVA